MRCRVIKVEVIFLPTLAFNEGIIMGIVDIFQTIVTQLGFINKIGSNKVIIMRGDLFTMQNMQGFIF